MEAPAAAAPVPGPLRWRLEAGAVRAGSWLLRALPEDAARTAGATSSRLLARAWPRYRRIAGANVAVAFPDWSASRRAALVDDHLRQLGRHASAWARLAAAPPEALLDRFEFEGVERLDAACAGGRGALVVTAHFGCWELILPALRARLPGRRLAAVGRGQRNPFLERLLAARRADRSGALPRSALALRRALSEGAAVGLLADHYLAERRGGLLAPFLGVRAWTSPAPAKLARAHGLPLLLLRTLPGADGGQRLLVGPEIAPPTRDEGAAGVARVTAQLNDAIGGWIRERPEQWLWLHNRFRASPDVEAPRLHAATRR